MNKQYASQYSWIYKYISKYTGLYVFALLLCLASTGLGLVNPYITGQIVKDVFQNGNKEILGKLLLILIAVTAVKSVVAYCYKFISELLSQDMLFILRRDIYKRVQIQTFSFFDSNRVGDIMARLTGDLDAIRHFVCFVIFLVLENILTFIIAVILMFSLSPQITLALLIVTPVIAITMLKQSKSMRPAFLNVREQFSKLNSVCQENISGNRVVKAFTKEDYETEKFDDVNDEYMRANVNTAQKWVKFMPIIDFCVSAQSVLMILVGGIMVINGKIELWQLVTLNGYLWAISNPLRSIGWLVNDTQRFFASLDKVYGMMSKPVTIKNPENPVKTDKLKGAVEFKNVSFSYDANNQKTKTLKDISFSVKPGQTVGIVGPTGSGKSTVTHLLSRFYDVDSGIILIDGINVKDYDLFCLRRDISAASQDVFLYSDNVDGNIAYGVPDIDFESVTAAAKVADAHDFIEHLENGYNTIIGERGVGLSGGQKQRLSLARAICADPSILILDDTTSAVDMETEHAIQLALKENYSDRTKFVIAHRISSVKNADLIIVLDNGKIIEKGSHEELMTLKGYYYGLFISQYGDYERQAI